MNLRVFTTTVVSLIVYIFLICRIKIAINIKQLSNSSNQFGVDRADDASNWKESVAEKISRAVKDYYGLNTRLPAKDRRLPIAQET